MESQITPPKWPVRFLQFILKADYLEEIQGDMEEVFQDNLENGTSPKRAKWRFILDTLKLIRPNLLRNSKWMLRLNFITMTLNNLKIAFRALVKHKTHTAINLTGLAIGLTIGGLIILYVSNELSFDNFHEKGNRIFKVVTTSDRSENARMETNAWPIAHIMKTEFPEVESVIYSRTASKSLKLNHDGKRYDHKIHYVGADFFNIFSFDLSQGDPRTALEDPYSVVITESIKQVYFDDENVIGKTMTFRDSINFKITGVIKELPRNSHIQFDMLFSFSTYEKLTDWFSYTEGWGNFNVRNYVLLKEDVDVANVQAKAATLYEENVGDWLERMGVTMEVDMIPLEDIYLRSGVYNSFGPSGSDDQVKTVSLIAIFAIILACINYINLSTARSAFRAKEVGIKKVNGSSRLSLISQFLMESYLLTTIAFIIAIVMMYLLLPFFNELIGREYLITYFLNPTFVISILVLVVLIAFLAGYYPALVISGFKPLEAIKGNLNSSPKGLGLRKALIVFQFFISAGLLLATFLVLSQINFMREQDLGFDKEQILVVDAINGTGKTLGQTYKTELERLTNVQSVSFTNALPGRPGWQGQWAYAGEFSEDHVDTEYMAIDETYIQTLGLKLLAGRNFEKERTSELQDGLVINETCVKAMGWKSPEDAIGKKIVSPSQRPAGTIIGVVQDYHGLGLQDEIWPKAMDYSSEQFGRYYAIRFTTGDTYSLMKEAEKAWKNIYSDVPFDYFFLDDDFDRQYREEDRLARVLTLFAFIILIISGIGLLGLISFVALSKTKEVGIRKTLGASVSNIVFIFSKEFVLLVIIGNFIAIPLVWYFGNKWLENFAYHTEVQFAIFPITILLTVLISFITVCAQTIKTAKMNPVEALRYE